MADIGDNLFYLVLLLEEFCDHRPAENDDPECRENLPDACDDPLHRCIQGEPSEKSEEDRASDQREKKGDPVPHADQGNEGECDDKRGEEIHQ